MKRNSTPSKKPRVAFDVWRYKVTTELVLRGRDDVAVDVPKDLWLLGLMPQEAARAMLRAEVV